MCFSGIGGSRTGSSQTTSNTPWGPAQEYFRDIYSNTQDAFNQGQENAMSPDRQNAWNIQRNVAQGAAGPSQQYQQMLGDVASGRYLDPATNPTLRPMVDAATRPMVDAFTQNFLPQVSSAAVSQGAYGGSRQGVAEALGSQQLTRNIGDVSAGIYGQNYANERNIQTRLPQMWQQSVGMQMLPAEILMGLADSQNQANWDPISRYAQIFSQLPSFTEGSSRQRDSGLSSLLNVGNTLGGLF